LSRHAEVVDDHLNTITTTTEEMQSLNLSVPHVNEIRSLIKSTRRLTINERNLQNNLPNSPNKGLNPSQPRPTAHLNLSIQSQDSKLSTQTTTMDEDDDMDILDDTDDESLFVCSICQYPLAPNEQSVHYECYQNDVKDDLLQVYIDDYFPQMTVDFGKHKGTPWRDMLKTRKRADYCLWILNCKTMWEGHKMTVRHLVSLHSQQE
jgi:hypothetical protein